MAKLSSGNDQQRLRAPEIRHRSLIEGAAYGIFRTKIDGTILDANAALAQLLGYPSVDELMRINIGTVFKSHGDHDALVDHCNRRRRQTLATDVKWICKDGRDIVVHLSARVCESEDGSTLEGIVEDVTERRALEERLQNARAVEATLPLARRAAHDLNNVLAAILGTAELLTLSLDERHPSREDVDHIRKAAGRGAELTRQLLTFGQDQAIEESVIDLNVVVPESIALLQRLAGDAVIVRVHTKDKPATVRTSRGRLEQLLMNLVFGARDPVPGGRTVEIDVMPLDLDERRSMGYSRLPPGPYVRITVSDQETGVEVLLPRVDA